MSGLAGFSMDMVELVLQSSDFSSYRSHPHLNDGEYDPPTIKRRPVATRDPRVFKKRNQDQSRISNP